MSSTNPIYFGQSSAGSLTSRVLRGTVTYKFGISVTPAVLAGQSDKGKEFKINFGNGINNVEASDERLLKDDGLLAIDGEPSVEMTNNHDLALDIRTSVPDRSKHKLASAAAIGGKGKDLHNEGNLTFRNVASGKPSNVAQKMGDHGKQLLNAYTRKGLTDFHERISPMHGSNEVLMNISEPSVLAHMYNAEASVVASKTKLESNQKDVRGRVYANAQAAANAKIAADALVRKELSLSPIGNYSNFGLSFSIPRTPQRGHNNRYHFSEEKLVDSIMAHNQKQLKQLGIPADPVKAAQGKWTLSGTITFPVVRPAY